MSLRCAARRSERAMRAKGTATGALLRQRVSPRRAACPHVLRPAAGLPPPALEPSNIPLLLCTPHVLAPASHWNCSAAASAGSANLRRVGRRAFSSDSGADGDAGTEQQAKPAAVAGPAEAREILGIEIGATEDQVKRAYFRMAMKCHPDLAGADGEGGSPHSIAQVNEAFSIALSDLKARKHEGEDTPGSTHDDMVFQAAGRAVPAGYASEIAKQM